MSTISRHVAETNPFLQTHFIPFT